MRHTRLPAPGDEIERIGYRPAAPYALDIEILSMRNLKGRVAAEDLRKAHRLEFHQLIFVTEGSCTHVIDFSPIPCERGSVLVHQPSQTEQYDITSAWDGWVVLFRPEFLFAPPSGGSSDRTIEVNLIGILAELPRHLPLPTAEFRLFRDAVSSMHADSKRQGLMAEIHALLRHQLCTLLIRLHMAQRHREDLQAAAPSDLRRFRRFQQLLERSFKEWHQVTMYANALGCSEKTLSRATLTVAGITAKAFIASRLSLEAKRMLVHTTLSVTAIGESLGFDDPSNFVKFFKREADCTPLELRRQHQST